VEKKNSTNCSLWTAYVFRSSWLFHEFKELKTLIIIFFGKTSKGKIFFYKKHHLQEHLGSYVHSDGALAHNNMQLVGDSRLQ
jgi:hypothetical protein